MGIRIYVSGTLYLRVCIMSAVEGLADPKETTLLIRVKRRCNADIKNFTIRLWISRE